ncbi:rubrerythrin family protein [Halobacterium hubeiense]|uniref:rubrerythrin family protein n=1 Tax=Halobacterium hubeiense TaxID=1407499 RepID=UPI003C74D4FC
MTPDEFLDAVRDDNETALSRLGSSKSLYAATGGEMDAGPVLEAAADAEHVAAQTFRAWADDEPHEEAADVFDTTASEEDDHTDAVLAELDDYQPADDATGMQASLRGLDDTVERAGALVGRVLATEKSKEQLTGFFVGQADPQTASLFRDLNDDLDDQRDRALALLETVCETDDDWQTAKDAADEAIQAAYDEYTEQLEAMGVNPKPVC